MKASKAATVQARARDAPVRLVSMPFKDLRHPPIQLGILESCLARAGVKARSHTFELAFMEHLHRSTSDANDAPLISISDYNHVAGEDFVVNLGDWIFNVPPYAEPSVRDQEYLDFAAASGISAESIATAVRMRKLVPDFLVAAADELLSGNPRVIGFSSVFQQNVPSLVLAKMLKARDPSLTIVFGGGNCDGPMGAALHECFPWLDVVVRGEGERAFVEVVLDVLNRRAIRPQPGLCYRRGGKRIIVPQDHEPQVPMDEVPAPIYDEFFDRLAVSPLREELSSHVAILFESSRGCWWGAKSHCTFCGLNGTLMKFRSKSAERVVEEILSFAERYKCLNFVAVDDIIDLGHIRDLLPRLAAAGYDLQLFYETKANLKKDQIRAFRSAGADRIQPGIESLSTPILRLMRKGVTSLQNVRLLKWCAEIGVTPAWNILYGFPGEPQAEYQRMSELVPSLVHLEPPHFGPVQMQRFSPYFDHPAEFGIELTGPEEQYRYLYDVSPRQLGDIAYDFGHRYLDGRDPETYVASLRDAVERWQRLSREGRGSLDYRHGPGFLVIADRRAGLEAADYILEAAEAKLFLGCEAGATPAQLAEKLKADGGACFDAEEIEEFLDELVDARLMYREGDLFLGLAIAANGDAARSTPMRETVSTAAL